MQKQYLFLQLGSYGDHEEFHSDMLLVRDNCRLYNPPGSTVRRDCDEVYAFYMSEYEKILEKWQKVSLKQNLFLLSITDFIYIFP